MNADDRKTNLVLRLTEVRAKTLWLLDQVPEDFFCRRIHSFYSPIGWHFGHIGRTEEFWVISRALQKPLIDERLTFLFADLPENPKDNRVNIPTIDKTKEYLALTRQAVLRELERADFDASDAFIGGGYAWEFALQHECQHQETIAEMLCLIHKDIDHDEPLDLPAPEWKQSVQLPTLTIPAGTFLMGTDYQHAYDNEKTCHVVDVEEFVVDKYPITAFQWSEFADDSGYVNCSLWTEAGWEWRQQENATAPEYHKAIDGIPCMFSPIGLRPIHPDEPVSCISRHEADAFCKWAGRRLLTEPEWEYLAGWDPEKLCKPRYPWGIADPSLDKAVNALRTWWPQPVGQRASGKNVQGVAELAGNVWEWTASQFLQYPGFAAFPYDGYSKDHMDGEHFVCRGGSWATSNVILQATFRNWYVPGYRQGFLGMRCAD